MPEKNETTQYGYKDVLIFGAREKNTGYYYWYWEKRINCYIVGGWLNSDLKYISLVITRYPTCRLMINTILNRRIAELTRDLTCGKSFSRVVPAYPQLFCGSTKFHLFTFSCLGNINNTFIITDTSYYYGWGDDDEYFKLRANLQQLDRETTSEFHIKITCKNLEYDDAASATTTIDIQILDANDNLPVFEKEIYTAKISKNIQSGADILQVMATDDDANENGKITYSLVYSSDSYIFSIDEKYGVISLKDHEKLFKPK